MGPDPSCFSISSQSPSAMARNILFVISYNSSNQVDSLLLNSDFQILNLSHIFIACNGHEFYDTNKLRIRMLATDLNLSITAISLPNKGYGGAINDCISFLLDSSSIYATVFFSNADIHICQSTTAKYRFTDFDICGFPMYQNSKLVASTLGFFSPFIPRRIASYLGATNNASGPCKAVHGGLFGLSYQAINHYSLRMREEFFLYWEELCLCYDALKMNLSVGVSDELLIFHESLKSTTADMARYYILRNGIYFYGHIYGNRLSKLVLPPIWACFALVLYILSAPIRSYPALLMAVLDGFRQALGQRFFQ
jgi:hypothetical protein